MSDERSPTKQEQVLLERIHALEEALRSAQSALKEADNSMSKHADITTQNRLGWARNTVQKALSTITALLGGSK